MIRSVPVPAAVARLRVRWGRLPGNLRGGLWMLVGALAMSSSMAIAKALAADIHPFELNFFRCIVGLVVLLPLALRGGRAVFRTRRLANHLGRGVLGGIGQVCVYYSLAFLPLAIVITITFTRPLFLVVLAVLFLGELVRWRRWTAIAVGFAGVLIVVRPVMDAVTIPLFVLVFSTLCHASAHVFLKKAADADPPMTVVFYYLIISTLVGAIPTAFVWTTPNAEQLAWLIASGVLYLMGQGLITLSFRAAEATAIMPFDYSRLLYGIAFDIVLFSIFPDAWTLAGSAVIVASALYVVQRQARLRRPVPPPAEET